MDIESLREFVALGTTLSFTEVASRFNIVQSTLSRHIQALEKELGTDLFDRSVSPVRLTEPGKVFLEKSADIVAAYDKALKETRASVKVPQKKYLIGGNLRVPNLFDAARKAAIISERNNMHVALYERHLSASHTDLAASNYLEDIEEGRIDVALIIAPKSHNWGALKSKASGHDTFEVLVDENHPLASKKALSLKELSPYPIVLIPLNDLFGASILEACHCAGFEPKTRTYCYESEEGMLRSWGDERILFIPKHLVSRLMPQEVSGLVTLDIDDPCAIFTIYVVWKESANEEVHRITKALIEALTQTPIHALTNLS